MSSPPNPAPPNPDNLITRRIVTASRQSLAGLKIAWGEEAFRIESFMVLVLVPLAIWFGETAVEQVLMIASLLIVMIVEILNTAVEKTIDRISTDRHPLSGQAKDLGSAAVMIALVMAALVWLALLLN